MASQSCLNQRSGPFKRAKNSSVRSTVQPRLVDLRDRRERQKTEIQKCRQIAKRKYYSVIFL